MINPTAAVTAVKTFHNEVQQFIYASPTKEKILVKLQLSQTRNHHLFIRNLSSLYTYLITSISQQASTCSQRNVADAIFNAVFESMLDQLTHGGSCESSRLSSQRLLSRSTAASSTSSTTSPTAATSSTELIKQAIIQLLQQPREDHILIQVVSGGVGANPHAKSRKNSDSNRLVEQLTLTTSLLEDLLKNVHYMSIKTQEKLHSILQALCSGHKNDYNSEKFLAFTQILLIKHIATIVSPSDFAPDEKISTQNYLSSSYNAHHDSIDTQSSMSRSMRQGSITRRPVASATACHHPPSPLLRLVLTSGAMKTTIISKVVDQGYFLLLVERLCEEIRKNSSEFQPKVALNLLKVFEIICANKQGIQSALIRPQSDGLIETIVSSLSFCQTSETINLRGANIVSLVNWIAGNLDGLLARTRCTSSLDSLLAQILSMNKNSHVNVMDKVCSTFLEQLRRVIDVQLEDQSRGLEQLQTDISLTALLPMIMIHLLRDLPDKRRLQEHFTAAFPFADQYECHLSAKTLSDTFAECVFLKELFVTMLEKTTSKTSAMTLLFSDFKKAFFSPNGSKKYDETLVGLQMSVLISGGESLCEQIVASWVKDSSHYESFKIYLSSDLSLFLQLLENDACYLNVIAAAMKDSPDDILFTTVQSRNNFRDHVFLTVKKLVINHLQMSPHGLDKETLRGSVQMQLSSQLLDYEGIFDAVVEDAATVKVTSSMTNNSYCGYERLHLSERYADKYFQSLFNRDVPLLVRLMNQIQTNGLKGGGYHDLHLESSLGVHDKPLRYLRQVRREMLENVKLHRSFHTLFIQNQTILLEKLIVVCRVLWYIYEVIEEGLEEFRVARKTQQQQQAYAVGTDTLNSLLMLYVFDETISLKFSFIKSLNDEQGQPLASQFFDTLDKILIRRNYLRSITDQLNAATAVELSQFN